MHEDIDRGLIKVALGRRIGIERLPHARVPKVVEQQQSLLEGGRNTLRLAYSGVTTEEIDEGVRRLAAAVRAVEASSAAA